jgi:hypothetical protein
MKRTLPWIVVAAAALVAAVVWYWWQRQEPPAAPPPVPRAEAPAPAPEAPAVPPPQGQHPIEQAKPDAPPAAEPPPAMADSDKVIRDALVGQLGRDAVLSHLNVGDYVRRVVATVDNLPRKHAPARLWPVTPTADRMLAAEKGDAAFIDPANARRYDAVVSMVAGADTGRLVALYVRLYPLFQQAYADLGHPNRHFNDRVVEVIDHLLAAPEVKGPVQVVRPEVKAPIPGEQGPPLWSYADPQLEGLSAGHKIMVRVGPEHAAKLKAKLRDVRRQIAAAPVKG